MKSFFKTVLAVICGILILQIVGFFCLMGLIGGAAASGSKTVLPRNGVLDITLADYAITEQSQENVPDFMSMSMTGSVGLWDAVQAIEAAAADPAIKCIFLRPDTPSAGMADLEELRAALAGFRRSGKPVVAYTENPDNGGYYLATVADKIYMTSYHGGTYSLMGLTSQQFFLKDILAKVGVNVQLIRHGKYKSAGEMFIRNGSSPENREQYQVMINSSWKAYADAIAEAREMPVETFNGLIDGLKLVFPEDFLENGLVDELMDRETLIGKLCTLAQVQSKDDLHLVGLPDYIAAKVLNLPGRTNVAVLFADGEITDGKGPNLAADSFVQVVDRIRKDASIKAVVLRVNSPGGSVTAAEKIRSALDLLGKEKPLVASYGDYAASGGYWISSGCQKIFTDKTSLTGSIGVFSMIPEFSQVSRKLGVGIESVTSNKHGDMLSLMRPFSPEETAYMQATVEDIYDRFVGLVAASRGMDTPAVDEIAQGRVWAGSDALGIGLADEAGTLKDAVLYAASLAGLFSAEDYKVVTYPGVPTTLESLIALLGQGHEEPTVLAGTPFEAVAKTLMKSLQGDRPVTMYARMPYCLDIR
ncbi:MAG: signal peptide peptidase SppA [Bacteroidales bacterium]|nr:signal peptide peptidase SppA [Bacteroidales bacterium]